MKQPSVRLVGFSLFSLVASDRELPQVSQGLFSVDSSSHAPSFTACSFVSEFAELLVGE